jgi:hypothetical protein
MFLAMKMKLVMAVAALAAPIALTVAPVPRLIGPRPFPFAEIAAAKFQYRWPATSPWTASRQGRPCGTCTSRAVSIS